MAVGDKTTYIGSLADTAFKDIQPGSGAEWTIHNIYHADDVELYVYDGSNSLLFDSRTGQGAWLKYAFQLTNGYYLRIKNVSGASMIVAFDGVVTK